MKDPRTIDQEMKDPDGERFGPDRRKYCINYKKYTLFIGSFVCLLIIVLVIVLLGKDPPSIEEDLDLRVRLYYDGPIVNNTTYVDTDSIEVRITNIGSVDAEGERITLSISGNNVIEDDLDWTGGNVPSGESASAFISVETIKPGRYFILQVMVRYDGSYECHDRIP
jgi:hypothetical protein